MKPKNDHVAGGENESQAARVEAMRLARQTRAALDRVWRDLPNIEHYTRRSTVHLESVQWLIDQVKWLGEYVGQHVNQFESSEWADFQLPLAAAEVSRLRSILDQQKVDLNNGCCPTSIIGRERVFDLTSEAGINKDGTFHFTTAEGGDMWFRVRWQALQKFADLVALEVQAMARTEDK